MKRKILKILSSCFGVLAVCGFSLFFCLDNNKNTQKVSAEEVYNVSFTTSSSLSYLNYDYYMEQVANGYTTQFSCTTLTSVTQVVNNGNIYYIPSLIITFDSFEVTNGTNTYSFNIFADSSFVTSAITFNNMVRENTQYLRDYQPTDIYCDIKTYGFEYTTRPQISNSSFRISLQVDLLTYLSNGVRSSVTYNQDITCYTDYSFTSGVSFGNYLGTYGGSWKELYRNNAVPTDSGLAYDEGYQQGYSNGYDSGKLDGYNQGVIDTQSTSYEEGYNAGVESQVPIIQEAYDNGYNSGYNEAYTADSTISTIFSNILLVGMLPVDIFLRMLNWEFLGINIASFVSALISVAATVIVIRLVTGKKNG